jgi:hypothetical protein
LKKVSMTLSQQRSWMWWGHAPIYANRVIPVPEKQ